MLTKRLDKTLDENHPREQAGFKCRYSTTEYIHVVNQLKEKCREYNIPLCIGLVDYEKVFNSVQTQAVLTSLQEQGIEDVYIEFLKEILEDSQWRDELDYYWKGTIWQRIAQYRHMGNQHTEAFAQPGDNMAVQ